MSWQDGYECYGTQDIDQIAGSSESDHPMLILLAHDGDNAFGGGYSYYTQCVKEFVMEGEGKVSVFTIRTRMAGLPEIFSLQARSKQLGWYIGFCTFHDIDGLIPSSVYKASGPVCPQQLFSWQ